MKYIFICLSIFSFCFGQAFAQTEDPPDENASPDSIIQYLSPLEYAFMMHEETKFMLRVPAWGVGAEIEVLPYLTWMTQIHTPLLVNAGNLMVTVNSEFRWYYGSRKLGIRNMSGNYIAAGAKYGSEPFSFPAEGYYIKWGMQRRILGNGLADIGILAGFNTSLDEGSREYGFFIKSPVALGFGFVFGERASLDRERLCSVVKCHEVERFLLKINFSDLISYNSMGLSGGHIRYWIFNPQVAAEKKVLDLPVSLNANMSWLMGSYAVKTSADNDWTNSGQTFEWSAGGRWYYNMQRRMRLGKGGNGLSGNYISAGVGGYYFSDQSSRGSNSEWSESLIPFVSTGVQRTLGRRLYFDLNIGVRKAGFSATSRGYEISDSGIEAFGNAHIGIKF